jgi:predicted PurR-regulated permease PerM
MGERTEDEGYFLLRHPILVAFAVIVIFGVLHVLAQAIGVILLGFLSVLLATLLSYPLDFFSRFMPRVLALILTIVLVVGGIGGLVLLSIPVLTAQAARFLAQLPVALARLQDWWQGAVQSGAVPELPGPGLAARAVGEIEGLLRQAVPFAVGLGSTLATVFVLFVLALFLAYAPDSYHEGLRRLVPRGREPLLDEAWARIGNTLRHWVAGVLISMTVMGVFAAVGLLIAGIDGWFLLGMLTFLGTFVPYVGAIASAVPGLVVGLAQSPSHFFYALLVYIGVHLLEGYLVSPFVMRYSVRLKPGLLLFWQLLVAAVFGLPGIIVATPLLAVLTIAVDHFYVERRLGKEPLSP